MRAIEVIIPIYNAPTDLANCLEALVTRLPAFARVWLVDDASTDARVEPLIADFLRRVQVSAKSIRNPANLGFVGTVNRAMALSKGDVLLLNSDTIVAGKWLERIAVAAQRVPQAASITPWSNNAEICSVPKFCAKNPVPANPDRIAEVLASAGTPGYPDLPTAVGFCMFLRRRALQKIGDFDRATFGRGYGEENDWSMRARGHGWRNILCDDAYVVHVGGRSFAETGELPGGENLARLVARYPNYSKEVSAFIETDPLKARRAEILGMKVG